MSKTIERRAPMDTDLRVRVTEEDLANLKAEAKRRGMSVSLMVRLNLMNAGLIKP